MFIKMAITQLIMGLSEKFFHLIDPWNPLYLEKYFIPLKGPGSNGLRGGGGLQNGRWGEVK